MRETSYLHSLNKALHELMEADLAVHLLGEDIVDPYGGAFKVSRGLSSKFPGRVIPTPISEACIAGIGAGMALRGLKPIIEIMFGDFITLAADQIVNHAAKFSQMYNGKVTVPLVIRTPMGAGRGYGPTHSQSLEKMFLGIPGLKVVAPSHFHDPGELLKHATLYDSDPVLFVEHKLLYPHELSLEGDDLLGIEHEKDLHGYPAAKVRNFRTGSPDLTILAYGGTSLLVEPLLRTMHQEEIRVAACLPSLVSSIPLSIASHDIRQSGRVIVIEEGTEPFGWSAEISSVIYEKLGNFLKKPIIRVTALDHAIPSSRCLEQFMLPNMAQLEKAIEEVLL